MAVHVMCTKADEWECPGCGVMNKIDYENDESITILEFRGVQIINYPKKLECHICNYVTDDIIWHDED